MISKFCKGDKVMICCNEYPEGTVGTIIDRVYTDHMYNVSMASPEGSWDEEFFTHQLKPYEPPRYKVLIENELERRKLNGISTIL